MQSAIVPHTTDTKYTLCSAQHSILHLRVFCLSS